MKKSITAVLVIGAAMSAGGCIIESNNNGGHQRPPSGGVITATWDIQDWNDTGKVAVAANCPPGADTAIVYSLSQADTDPANAYKDLFNCSDITGTTAGLPADAYTFWVEITDHSGATLFAQSNSQTASVRDGGNTVLTFPFQVNRGYVSAAWTLQGATSGQTLSCATAGANGVEFDNMVGNALPISDQFKCTDGQGTTYPLPIANYSLAIQAIDASKPPAGLGPATVAGPVNVQYGNQLINKGSYVLSITGK